MNTIQKRTKNDKTVPLTLALSFTVPATVLLICFAVCEIAPFGDRTLCSMDGYSQYYPMLMTMTEAVKNGEPFYSWNGALGFNLWAQSGYYTNSPLWLPLYFIPHSFQLSYINLSVLFRLSLGGLFFCLYLIRTHKGVSYKKSIRIFPALSLAWALSGYMTAFMNQLMWTDVVVLLPLVILGIHHIKENGSPLLYIFTLFISIASCFYISFMVCIFVVLWFFFLMFKEHVPWKSRFKCAVNFGVSSLLAGGMSAAVILPVYKALSLTKASDLGFEGVLEANYSLKEFLLRILPFQKTSLEYDLPNIYCTLTVFILFFFFLFSKKITRRHKISAFIFVTFMFLSMCINLGEFVWHGFHYPNQLPARQSFLVIFLMLTLAGEYLVLSNMKKKHFYTVIGFIFAGALLNFSVQFSRDVWTSKVNSLQKYESVMENFTASDDDDIFARMEWTDVKKNNYPQQYNYKGISYYSSTMSGDAYDFFQQTGMDRYAKNVSVRYKQSDILNALFSVRYIMSGEHGGKITENENVLSLGFVCAESVYVFEPSRIKKPELGQQLLWDCLCDKSFTSFSEGYSLLSQNQLQLTVFDTDYIEGTLESNRSGVFFTSVPYDEGWEIFIDGEKQQTKKAAGYFLSCPIKKGNHEITMKYTVPGIKIGAVISVISFMAAICWIFIEQRIKMRNGKYGNEVR
ncbi:MAG: YfhO family protein [Clostridia bacterium]|nr:YfhO family protein [Clostridia bacterium]